MPNVEKKAKRPPRPPINFTTDKLTKLQPEATEYMERDAGHAGLALRVRPTGAKTFCFFRHVPATNRTERITLGKFAQKGGMTIDAARKRATEVQGTVNANKSPALERSKYKDSDTLEVAFANYMTNHVRAHLAEKTGKDFQQLYDGYIVPSRLHLKKLVDIDHGDVETLHVRLGVDSKWNANKVAGLIRAIYNHAAKHVKTPLANPIKGLKMFDTPGRERYLTVEEFPRFVAALAETPQPWRDFFRMLMLTGVRLNNMLSARFDQFDLTHARWTIAGADHKNKKTHSMPLPQEAVEIVRRRLAAVPKGCPWLWPATGKRHSESGHITHVGEPWSDLCERAEITDLRRHDMRHTLASWMVMSGEGLPIVGKQLGHVSMQSTQKYAHLATEATRSALESTLAKMAAAGTAKK